MQWGGVEGFRKGLIGSGGGSATPAVELYVRVQVLFRTAKINDMQCNIIRVRPLGVHMNIVPPGAMTHF